MEAALAHEARYMRYGKLLARGAEGRGSQRGSASMTKRENRMAKRAAIPSDVIADVLMMSRRRCCICFALSNDGNEKKGQVAHLDRNASNNSRENLVFLCFDHHDQYDSKTSQSKGLTVEEVRRYRAQLDRFVAQSFPPSDVDIARALLGGLDRPTFRTPFHQESSLPRFREAIAEAISRINTGRMPNGKQLPSKADVGDPAIHAALDNIVRHLVSLRATFDDLLKRGDIRRCDCQDPDCSVHMLSWRATHEMDRRRHELLVAARAIDPAFPAALYDLDESD